MATKAQNFRTEQRRSKPKKERRPRRRRDQPVDTSKPGVSATDRHVGAGSTAARNRSERAGRNPAAVLEDSATPRASRRSTRRSGNRTKRDNSLRLRSTLEVLSPEATARRAQERRGRIGGKRR
jgi:hypothetical protein